MLEQGSIFDNRYQLIRLLGRGGFAEVWLVTDKLTGLEEALKVYAPGGGMNEDGLKVFAQELSVVHNLRHTNLLTPKTLGQYQNQPYLILPFCPNGSLNKKVGAYTEDEAWKILEQVASGLAYLHQRNIVHQDIKPDNILVDENNDYVITDFGISLKAQSTLRKSMRAQTQFGTMEYMAPERFSENPLPTKASDVWALGTMMFELVTGNVPFEKYGGGKQQGGAKIPTIHADVSNNLKQIIYSLLAENVEDRPTAAQVAEWAKKRQGYAASMDVRKTRSVINRETQPIEDHKAQPIAPTSSIPPQTPLFVNRPPSMEDPIVPHAFSEGYQAYKKSHARQELVEKEEDNEQPSYGKFWLAFCVILGIIFFLLYMSLVKAKTTSDTQLSALEHLFSAKQYLSV